MSSRGSKIINGHVTTNEFILVKKVANAKVLKAIKGHNSPDYSHTPNSIYIRELENGEFRELRVYGDKGQPMLEIGYHGEISLTGNRNKKVLHYHLFDEKLARSTAKKMTKELSEKYKEYLEVYGLWKKEN